MRAGPAARGRPPGPRSTVLPAGRQTHDRRFSGVYEAHRGYKRSFMARVPSTIGGGLEVSVATRLWLGVVCATRRTAAWCWRGASLVALAIMSPRASSSMWHNVSSLVPCLNCSAAVRQRPAGGTNRQREPAMFQFSSLLLSPSLLLFLAFSASFRPFILLYDRLGRQGSCDLLASLA